MIWYDCPASDVSVAKGIEELLSAAARQCPVRQRQALSLAPKPCHQHLANLIGGELQLQYLPYLRPATFDLQKRKSRCHISPLTLT